MGNNNKDTHRNKPAFTLHNSNILLKGILHNNITLPSKVILRNNKLVILRSNMVTHRNNNSNILLKGVTHHNSNKEECTHECHHQDQVHLDFSSSKQWPMEKKDQIIRIMDQIIQIMDQIKRISTSPRRFLFFLQN